MKKSKNMDQKAEELAGKVQVVDQQPAENDSFKVQNLKGSDTEIHDVDEPKAAINTKKAAEVVAAGTNSIGGGALSLRGSATSFSGGAGSTRMDESATTRETHTYKAGDRPGRRADSITKKIDYLDAEAFKTTIKQSKPLSETTEKQGYNGNYLNEHAITQRASGGVPGDPLFERSVDEISFDMLYYTLGQQVSAKSAGEFLHIRSWNPTLNNGAGGYDNPTSFPRGDFLPLRLEVTFNRNGEITNFVPVVREISPKGVDERVSRAAADTVRRFDNISELDRNTMISVAGNESDPGWSCLGDGIIDATDQNRLIRLLDAAAGNISGVSARKLGSAGAYQINKTAKDGARKTGPVAEMCNGCIDVSDHSNVGSTTYVDEAQGLYLAFHSTDVLLHGGAGLWLGANDSIAKYTTKGKVLSLPLSFKSALATAQSNMDPLICDVQLFELLKHNELFSEIDGPYDPLKPLIVTDKVGLVHPINPFVGCKFENGQFSADLYIMHYENLRNKYNVVIRNFFAQGIFDWFTDKASRIVDYLATQFRNENNPWNDGEKTLIVPIVSSTTSFSLWDLIVCQAVPYIVERRLTTMTELIKYEKNHGYPYSNVAHLKDVDIFAADNYSYTDIEKELVANIAKPVAAMKVVMPEVFWPVAKFTAQGSLHHNGIGAKVVLPHYFVQNQFQYDQMIDMKTAKLLLSEDFATMAYPSTRSGTNFAFLDTIYGMEEEDYKLSLDRMVTYPAYEGMANIISTKIAQARGVGDQNKYQALTYKYGLATDGLVVIPYFAYASDANNKAETLTIADILRTPRELGLMQVAPAGLLTPMRVSDTTNNKVDVDSSYLGLSGPGFRVKLYHAVGTEQENEILTEGSVNINNNASLEYVYDVLSCNTYGCSYDNGCIFNAFNGRVGLSPFTAGAYDPDYGTYDSQTGEYVTGEQQDTDIILHTSQKYNWTRIQRLPFGVNPFDCNADTLISITGDFENINSEDIFNVLYDFGFCGFRASDYSELIHLRVKERIAKGMNYVVDPFIDKSMLLK